MPPGDKLLAKMGWLDLIIVTSLITAHGYNSRLVKRHSNVHLRDWSHEQIEFIHCDSSQNESVVASVYLALKHRREKTKCGSIKEKRSSFDKVSHLANNGPFSFSN